MRSPVSPLAWPVRAPKRIDIRQAENPQESWNKQAPGNDEEQLYLVELLHDPDIKEVAKLEASHFINYISFPG